MKMVLPLVAVVAGALVVAACNSQPVQRVTIPSATDPATYQPQAYPKPLPPAGYDPSMQVPTAPVEPPSIPTK